MSQTRTRWPNTCWRYAVVTFAITIGMSGSGQAQTLVQLADLGNSFGPRLTRQVARAKFDNRALFGTIGTKVAFIDNGTPYQLLTDPTWGRVIVAKKDAWIKNWVGVTGTNMSVPLGIDISARKFTYIAERGRSRILVSLANLGSGTFTNNQVLNTGGRPIDVAWDGLGNPLTNDYLYVLDDSSSRVTYWNMNGSIPTSPIWSFGARGTGDGQFMRPSGICVSKSPALNGGTTFTNVFFVVDRGNHRVVRLIRGSAGASVYSTVSLPGWDPTDCTVDHFGNLYVSDAKNSKLHKFDGGLNWLDSYGTYGTGATNLGTLDHPTAVSVPCGLKVSGTQTVWYCEGRLITAERWSDSTGVVEHYLGINADFTGAPVLDGFGSASVEFRFTDAAYISVTVQRVGYGLARTLMTDLLMYPGEWATGWDGHMEDGSIAPTDDYIFRVYMRSAYGCPDNFHQQWCEPRLYSAAFHYEYCVPAGGGGGGGGGPLAPPAVVAPTSPSLTKQLPPPPPTCGGGPLAPKILGGGLPTRFAVRQLPSVGQGVPVGVSALSATGASPSMSASGGAIGAAPGAVQGVQRSGVMTAQVNAPAAGTLKVQILGLDGRVVRNLSEVLPEGGQYSFRWDGRTESGATARPGVYLALFRYGGDQQQTRFIKVGE